MAGISFSCESGVEQMTKACYRDGFGAGAITVTCSTQENSLLWTFSCFYERRKLTDTGFLPILSITAVFSFACTLCHLFLAGYSKHVLFQQTARKNVSLLSNHKVTAGCTNLCIHLESRGWTWETSVWFLLPSNSQCLNLDHEHICVLIRTSCNHSGVILEPKPHNKMSVKHLEPIDVLFRATCITQTVLFNTCVNNARWEHDTAGQVINLTVISLCKTTHTCRWIFI